MPYHINSSAGKFEVVDDQGNVKGTHPTRKQAVAQLQALYANVPDAKKEASDLQEIDIKELLDENIPDTELKAGSISNLTKHLSKKHSGDPGFFTSCMSDDAVSGYDHDARAAICARAHHIATGRWPAQDKKKEAQEAEPPKLSVIDRVIAALKGDFPGHPFRGNQYDEGANGESESVESGEFSHIKTPRKGDTVKLATDPATKNELHLHDDRNVWLHSPSGKSNRGSLDTLRKDRFASRFQWHDVTSKEGRRNSSPDGDRLQQIHDLAVLNGASCPMVMKEASGALRWVLLSSNAFQDSDKEIISRAALEADVARTDKEQAPFGPLRWWHMGAPDPIGLHAGSGADIGDCDYRAMSGRVLIESGTFRNERIGEAIKERADTLAGSIGFFHPKDEPDDEGVYRTVVTFERSLLPRGKASNTLTALTVKGEESMATSKEKTDALAALLGDPKLAEAVIQQAEQTEKAADDRGLKYKEEKSAEPPAPPAEVATKAPTGEVTAVPAHGNNGLMKAFGLSDDDDDEMIAEKMYKAFAPRFEKLIAEKMSAGAKEQTEKESGLKAALDAIAADVKELKGDMPRGLQGGFRASVADATILNNVNFKNAPTGDPLDSVIDQLMGVKK